jgi:hypothetical protein
MNLDEYNKLFHNLELNLVAFKPLMECNQEVLKLVNAAIEAEREECAKACELYETGLPEFYAQTLARVIRARWIHD